MARWIIKQEKALWGYVVKNQGRHDAAELKALMIKLSGRN
jgi:hypothetical protein